MSQPLLTFAALAITASMVLAASRWSRTWLALTLAGTSAAERARTFCAGSGTTGSRSAATGGAPNPSAASPSGDVGRPDRTAWRAVVFFVSDNVPGKVISPRAASGPVLAPSRALSLPGSAPAGWVRATKSPKGSALIGRVLWGERRSAAAAKTMHAPPREASTSVPNREGREATSAAMLAKDPDNRYLWRMTARRMEGEAVRDSLLAAAGRLDAAMGGPDIDHRLGETVPRRSLYFRHAAEKQMEFLLLFDPASVNECYKRSESVIPQQALALSNSKLLFDNSLVLARHLSEGSGDTAFIRGAFESVLGRPPSSEEQSEAAAFLGEQMRLSLGVGKPEKDRASRARANLVLALFNHNDFVTAR